MSFDVVNKDIVRQREMLKEVLVEKTTEEWDLSKVREERDPTV
jgi:hypothetical protein